VTPYRKFYVLKVAIYSRVLESTQQKDVQLFFDELENEQIGAVIFQPFLNDIRPHVNLHPSFETFASHEDLTDEIDL
jgi:NAD+ kinase